VEVADGLAGIRHRGQAVRVIDFLTASALVQVVPATSSLFLDALSLYRRRADKSWGVTDCSSFIVMKEFRLSAALTSDEHFRQAGYRALLREDVPR
jgi:predicted nucleic acid-binding protein